MKNSTKSAYFEKEDFEGEIYTNIQQNIIHTTEDKIRLILNDVKAKWSSDKLEFLCSNIVTIIVALVTSEFKNFFFIDGVYIKSLFIFSLFILLYHFVKILTKSRQNKMSLDDVIEKIKNTK